MATLERATSEELLELTRALEGQEAATTPLAPVAFSNAAASPSAAVRIPDLKSMLIVPQGSLAQFIFEENSSRLSVCQSATEKFSSRGG